MLTRGDIVWADLGPGAGRRPVCILTRDAAIPVLDRIVCAQITTTVRGIRSEVQVGPVEGLATDCAISCDNVVTVHKHDLDRFASGHLGPAGRRRIDEALAFALDIGPGIGS